MGRVIRDHPRYLRGEMLNTPPDSSSPKTHADMKPHVKFWIATSIAGVWAFYHYVYPTLPEEKQQGICTAILVALMFWECVSMIIRGESADGWEPSKESIFSYNGGEYWVLGCSIVYLTIYGIRQFNRFIDNISILKI